MEENRDGGSKTIIQLIISGGQVNISTDNGEVNANQNNEPKIIEKQVIIENESQNYTRNRNRKSGETDNGTVLLGGLVLILQLEYMCNIVGRFYWGLLLYLC